MAQVLEEVIIIKVSKHITRKQRLFDFLSFPAQNLLNFYSWIKALYTLVFKVLFRPNLLPTFTIK